LLKNERSHIGTRDLSNRHASQYSKTQYLPVASSLVSIPGRTMIQSLSL
jgi:hypothetical protein